MRTLILRILLLVALLAPLRVRAADPQPMVAVMVSTNLALGVGFANFFQTNAAALNAAVLGVNTNLSGLALASGTATLANGSNVVSSIWAFSTNRITLGYRTLDGTVSAVLFYNFTNGVSFTLLSANTADTNKVDWVITKP